MGADAPDRCVCGRLQRQGQHHIPLRLRGEKGYPREILRRVVQHLLRDETVGGELRTGAGGHGQGGAYRQGRQGNHYPGVSPVRHPVCRAAVQMPVQKAPPHKPSEAQAAV